MIIGLTKNLNGKGGSMSNNLVTVQDDFITALKQNKNYTEIAEKIGE